MHDFGANFATLGRWFFGTRHAFDDAVRNVYAGYIAAHPLCHLGRTHGAHSDQNKDLAQQTEVFDLLHIGPQTGNVVAVLGLDELGASSHFLSKPLSTPVKRLHKRVGRRTQKDTGRKSHLSAALEAMLVAHAPANFEQGHAVQVKHRFGLGMVTGLHTVATQAQHVAHTHGRTAQNIALNGDAVFVAAGDLHHRCVSHTRQQGTYGQAGHMAVGAAAVGGVDGVHIAVKHFGAAVDLAGVGRIGRLQLAGDGKAATAQHALQAPRRGVAGQDG